MKKNLIMSIKRKIEWGESSKKKMNYNDAKKWCEKLGDGWRLPTYYELYLAYESKVEGFKKVSYWSLTVYYETNACVHNFRSGKGDNYDKNNLYYVRLVRDIK